MKKSRKSSKTASGGDSRQSDKNLASPDVAPSHPTHHLAEAVHPPLKTYRMQLVAGQTDEAVRNDIVNLWSGAAGLSGEQSERRSRETILTLYLQEGPLVGVTSAHLVMIHNVGICWHVRMFLLPEHRGFLGKNGQGLPTRMLGASMAFLAQRGSLISQNRPLGIVMILENKKNPSPRLKSAFEGNGWQFAGTTSDGSPALFHPLVYHVEEGGRSSGGQISA